MPQLTVFHDREELRVPGVGAGPAAFDEIDAEVIEAQRQGDLVPAGQVEIKPLGAVTQSRVVYLHPGAPAGIRPGLAQVDPRQGLGAHGADSFSGVLTTPAASLLSTST